jgi:hypothetical protein
MKFVSPPGTQRSYHFSKFRLPSRSELRVQCLTSSCIMRIKIQGIHKRMVRFQKLIRNVFLTLHWHNVHRQQRQLSKFLMRYQQFPSHAYCMAAGAVSKMAPQQGKAFCALRFEVSRSATPFAGSNTMRFLSLGIR